MKKNIILLEDRPNRQKTFMKNYKLDFNNFKFFKNVCGGQEFYLTKDKILKGDIDEYDVIIAHRSAFTPIERNQLIKLIEQKSKILVFFSGGISSTNIKSLGKGKMISMHSKDLYSSNMDIYLNNDSSEILELAFGEKWKLDQLCIASEKLALYSLNYEDLKPASIISEDLTIPEWIYIKFFPTVNLESGKQLVEKHQLLQIIKKINTDIGEILL